MKPIKIFLFSLLLIAVSVMVQAQTESTYAPMISTTNNTAVDTVPGNATRAQVLRVSGWWDKIVIMPVVTEITGATSGTVKLWGSINGTNYVQIDSSYFSPSDITGAQSFLWNVNKSRYTYYKVLYTGAGTMSAKLSTGFLKRSQLSSSSGTLSHFKSVSNGTLVDTATNSATKSQVLRLPGYQDLITVVTTVTEISGATGGTVKLYGSIDGVNYVLAKSDYFSPADQPAAQSYKWEFNESPFTYWKAVYVPANSMSAKISTDILSRKK